MTRIRNHSMRIVVSTIVIFGLLGFQAAFKADASQLQRATQTVDFDGDGRTDVTLFDSALARWFTYDFYSGSIKQFDIGSPGDIQVVGDYDGDGLSDFAVCYDKRKPAVKMWQISYSSNGPKGDISWGIPGDIPVPADYDGDGLTDIAVFRPANGTWYVRLSKTKSTRQETLGNASDTLVPADYDGDGLADIAVMRPDLNVWNIHFSSNDTIQEFDFSLKSTYGDIMVPADYDGDGFADIAIYRKNGGLWIIFESSTRTYRFAQFGNGIYTGDSNQADVTEKNFDLPIPGDFDGDRIVDIAVWNAKSRVVNVLPSSSSIMTSIPIGTEGSRPVSHSVLSKYQEF